MALYFITISPKYRVCDPSTLYQQDTHLIRRLLNPFSKHYCLYPEFSPGGTARLHYHGIVRIDDQLKYNKTKYKIDKLLGYTKFDKISNFTAHLRALTYSMKDWRTNIELFLTPIIYMRLRRTPLVDSTELDVGILQYLTKYKSTYN